jgi:hypothetical protein
VFDWVFDGAVNRIVQQAERIVLHYGLYSFERVIHMDQREHRLETEPLAIVRDYVVEDPAYFAEPYMGSDKVLAADVPYVAHPCEELAPEFIPPAP